ncbi:MAG TPA: type II toxin-antitoxin system VapC family toxin [Candidatus Angelobacter sp.]|nr:type II toxin-antitoxin system VapC family toxin [Candidatus Angelobacter sp.]
MNGFLLDTNVLSEFVRPDNKPDYRVQQWLESADPDSLYSNVLTFGEIRRGIEKLPLSKRRTHLETWLEKDLHEWFENRLLVIDEAIANRWGVLAAAARRKGTPLAIIDGLLSATALEHTLTVVTRNSTDFVNAGVPILDPWRI